MSHLTLARPGAFGAGREISSLLLHLAGEFAPALAAIWPAPHAPFVTAPAARRHLVCLALAGGRSSAHVGALLDGPLAAAIRGAVANPPPGLARALGRLGEVSWSAADYGRLRWALAHPRAAKAVRHAARVTPELVRTLAALPEPMMLSAARADIGPAGAELLRECLAEIARVKGEAAAAELAGRWAGMSLPKLRKSVLGAFAAEPPPPPFPGTARLRPLASLEALRAAGRRHRNCLRDDLSYLADGSHAYYEWTGEPAALVELYKDPVIGWRFEQARLSANAPVPSALAEAILAELDAMGVGLGRPYWQLRQAVAALGGPGFHLEPLERISAERFGRD